MTTIRNLAESYIADVTTRGATSMLEGFKPNWDDRPWRNKRYIDVVGINCANAPAGGSGPSGASPLASTISALREAIGVNGRRLRLTPNNDTPFLAQPQSALWSRGAASGGGLYPTEAYLIVGDGCGVLTGVYHYDSGRHALNRLSVGNVTGQVAAALGSPRQHQLYVAFTTVFWKNSFKYNDLAYHVVTLDHGAVLEAWRIAATETGVQPEPPVLRHDEHAINALLGLDGIQETTLSIIAIGAPQPAEPASGPSLAPAAEQNQRSRTIIDFKRVAEVQREAALCHGEQLNATEVFPDRGDPARTIELEAGSGVSSHTPLESMRRRRSSFGTFTNRALTQNEARLILESSDRAIAPGALTPGTVSLVAIIRNVEGLEPGVYDVERKTAKLGYVGDAPPAADLQSAYFLDNYSLAAVAMIIMIVANPVDVIQSRGPRGLRDVNAQVGACAQQIYLTAAEIETGCGVVLGFDNKAFGKMARLPAGWSPMLLAMVGPERLDRSDYVFMTH